MVDPSSDRAQAATDAESAFMTLSHDRRLEILLALWDASGFSLSFSELRKAVGVRDSGSFTYHLSELQGHFVAKTDAGYELQYPGHRVLDAIQSGVFHEQVAVGPVDLESDCRECGERLTFEYDTDYIARIRCQDCGNRALEWPFDPGGIAGRDSDAMIRAFDRRTRLIWSCALDSVCPFCAGRIDPELTGHVHEEGACVGVIEQLDRYDEYFARDHPAVISVDCERCSFYSFVPVGVVLLTRPAVVGRLHEADIDLRETPLWDLGFVVDPDAVTVRQTDPIRAEVMIPDANESLGYLVDGSLDVIDERDR
ncbi:winged helix-turn-helix domain-containing protein [Natrinema halophilum]|uniref:Winged helix-turn-helix transcriptional regulator n=1 Tax=Natrinema halophilum TaxID=1699371 RepID=A0A7D5KZL9_9EURY|nr:winged helix-turn-helix domain-containing protein [Natrinema halophilum]QLG49560.1 winged helix-turn-helix domain-containing protein [Natrinema halophilum]